MARTNDTEIGLIFDIDTTIITDTTPFIAAANRLVTQFCSTDNYSTTELTEIDGGGVEKRLNPFPLSDTQRAIGESWGC